MANEMYVRVGTDDPGVDDDLLRRMKLRTGSDDDDVLNDCIESAKHAILTRRYPFAATMPDDVEARYKDLQFRVAMDIYNRIGSEGETSHSENGIGRSYESSWISEQLLSEVTPIAGVF